MSARTRNGLSGALFSFVLLLPCFWQTRIQSADLGSHIYNAWLASQIHARRMPGLSIHRQSTNILFDVVLEWLLVHVGADWAQRVAVSVCVLIFGWGAVILLFRIGSRNWWFVGPCAAMLAYGFIFWMGFFNFYLSLGLCLWVVAILWPKRDSNNRSGARQRNWIAYLLCLPILFLAWLAHPLPFAWALVTIAYAQFASRLSGSKRIILFVIALSALLVVRLLIVHKFPTNWSYRQIMFVLGTNQFALFGWKYVIPIIMLLFVWVGLFVSPIRKQGADMVSSPAFQLWILNAVAVALIPSEILLPQFDRPLGFVAERISLTAALMLCGVLAAVPIRRGSKVLLISAAVVFFAFLYVDARQLNETENRIERVVSSLPAGSRVLTTLSSASLGSLCEFHDLDRACIGHCYSYANYEPSSRQFRIRVLGDNDVVLNKTSDIDAAATGAYVVQSRDLPIYAVYPCGAGGREICSRMLQIGEKIGNPH